MKRFDDFYYARWFRRINRLTQILLAVALITGLNFLASRHFTRWDLTQQNRYSLAPETLAYLGLIPADQKIKIIVTLPTNAKPGPKRMAYEDVSRLLREYDYASRRGGERRIEIEYVDVLQQLTRSLELEKKYGPLEENSIMIAMADRYRIVPATDLYVARGGQAKAFRGEEAITSAMLDVIRAKPEVIYFISGHGQMRLDDVDPARGLSQLAGFLRQRNIMLQSLNLAAAPEVPEDASMIVIAAPQVPMLPQEVEKVRRYLDQRSGRLMVLLNPGQTHGLEDLFWDWGILTDDKLVLDVGEGAMTASGDVIVRRFSDPPHPTTELLINYQLPLLMGPMRPARPDPGRALDERLQVEGLLFTSDLSWGERDYARGGEMRFDPEVDLAGPLSVAVVAERGSELATIGINLPGGRVVVFGDADFIANNRFNIYGNKILMMNTINWMVDRMNLLNIPPRPIEDFHLILSRQDMITMAWRIFALPGLVLLAGFGVYIIRRR